MKKVLLLLAVLIIAISGNAQQIEASGDDSNNKVSSSSSSVSLDVGTDVMSRYIWRGLQFGGNSPSIQPYAEVGIGGFAIGAWGAYSTNAANTGQEFDLYASYTFLNDMVSIGITDYFFPDDTATYDYLEYSANKTGHILEGFVSFNGTSTIPVSLMAAINFFGADSRTVDGDLQYSTYIELGYSTSIGSTNLDLFLGATPSKPDTDKGEVGFYGPYEGVINLGCTGSKEISITDQYALPLSVSLISNPQAEKVFMVLGISF